MANNSDRNSSDKTAGSSGQADHGDTSLKQIDLEGGSRGDSPLASEHLASAKGFSTTSGASDLKFRLPLLAKLGLIFVLVGLATLGYFRTSWHQSEEAERAGLVEIDKEELAKRALVQDFDIKDLLGKTHKISDFRGKVVILSFWASWCTPCLVEMPTIAALYNRLKDKGLVIIPINEDDEPEAKTTAQEFWKKNAFEFPTYVDFSKKIAEQFKVEALPSNFVIDRTGRLVFSGFGENDWSSPQMVEAIEKVLNETVTENTEK